MHLALLLDAPIGELILQGPVILSEKSVLPGVQKARERHTFLFETALLICKDRINDRKTCKLKIKIRKELFYIHSFNPLLA